MHRFLFNPTKTVQIVMFWNPKTPRATSPDKYVIGPAKTAHIGDFDTEEFESIANGRSVPFVSMKNAEIYAYKALIYKNGTDFTEIEKQHFWELQDEADDKITEARLDSSVSEAALYTKSGRMADGATAEEASKVEISIVSKEGKEGEVNGRKVETSHRGFGVKKYTP